MHYKERDYVKSCYAKELLVLQVNGINERFIHV